MKSLPKGVRAVRKRLADGSVAIYHYHRATGARLPPPDDRSFGAKLAAAKQGKGRYAPGTLGALTIAYRQSPEWRGKKLRTQENQLHYMRPLERLHHLKVADIRRRHILELRDALALASGSAAANTFATLAATIFTWARDRGWIEHSPADRIRAIPGGHWPAWTPLEADAAIARLPEHLRRAVVLARYSGQRRGDLVRMAWSAYDGSTLRLRQEKTGAELILPVHNVLKVELDAWKRSATSTLILTTAKGVPWRANHLSNAMARGLQAIGLPKRLNVHGLRKLAATALAEAGCSVHEIAAITGHRTLAMVALYTASADQERLARAAMLRLENAQQPERKPRATSKVKPLK
jgi:integrase